MIAKVEQEQVWLIDQAIKQALHERDKCREHLKSIENLAVAHSETAIHRLAAIEYGRLEKQWRKDPYHYRIPFASNHLGAANMVRLWTLLVAILRDVTKIPSLDLVLECIRSDGSPVEIQSIRESSRKFAFDFLRMQASPDPAITAWLKLSKCVDSDYYLRLLQSITSRNHDINLYRQEMLVHALSKLRCWHEVAGHAQTRFEEYCNTFKNSTIPACQIDRTFAASLRDAKLRLNRAEKLYLSLLKQHRRDDLSITADSTAKSPSISGHDSPITIIENPNDPTESTIAAGFGPVESDELAPELLHVMSSEPVPSPVSGKDTVNDPAYPNTPVPLTLCDHDNSTSVSAEPSLAINIIDPVVAEYGDLGPLTELDLICLRRFKQQRSINRRKRRKT